MLYRSTLKANKVSPQGFALLEWKETVSVTCNVINVYKKSITVPCYDVESIVNSIFDV